jgi:hypothetical protein
MWTTRAFAKRMPTLQVLMKCRKRRELGLSLCLRVISGKVSEKAGCSNAVAIA